MVRVGFLPRASELWVQASLDYKQRLQQLFFPEGIAYDGIRFNRTAVTAPLFNYLARRGIERMPRAMRSPTVGLLLVSRVVASLRSRIREPCRNRTGFHPHTH